MGRTSLWMFPIYGMGVLLPGIVNTADRWPHRPVCISGGGEPVVFLQKQAVVRHSFMDMVLIFTAEYVTGTILKYFNVCPWDYSMWPDHIGGVIGWLLGPCGFAPGFSLRCFRPPADLKTQTNKELYFRCFLVYNGYHQRAESIHLSADGSKYFEQKESYI